jgi:hypothetical protein
MPCGGRLKMWFSAHHMSFSFRIPRKILETAFGSSLLMACMDLGASVS